MAKAITHRDVYWYYPNLVGYARVVATLLAIYVGRHNHVTFCGLYLFSFVMDAIDGKVARMFDQCTLFGGVLDMVTDRCSTAMLLVLLGALWPEWYFLWAACLGLDISSHWFHMYRSTMTQEHHKNIQGANFIVRFYYEQFYFFAYLCIGNELFYVIVYLLAFREELPQRVASGLHTTFFFALPGFSLKQFVNVFQLLSAAGGIVAADVAKKNRPD